MCDPYIVEGKLETQLYSEYRKEIFSNKSFFFGGIVSGITFEGGWGWGLYSYIDEKIELNIFDAVTYANYFSPSPDIPVVPIFGYGYVDLLSIVYYF